VNVKPDIPKLMFTHPDPVLLKIENGDVPLLQKVPRFKSPLAVPTENILLALLLDYHGVKYIY